MICMSAPDKGEGKRFTNTQINYSTLKQLVEFFLNFFV